METDFDRPWIKIPDPPPSNSKSFSLHKAQNFGLQQSMSLRGVNTRYYLVLLGAITSYALDQLDKHAKKQVKVKDEVKVTKDKSALLEGICAELSTGLTERMSWSWGEGKGREKQ